MSPTQRSLDYLRSLGYKAEVVEHYHFYAKKRHDLWGIFDIIYLTEDGQTGAVQTTSGDNVSARLKKVTESEFLPWLRRCGWTLAIHGWRKSRKDGKYKLRIVNIS